MRDPARIREVSVVVPSRNGLRMLRRCVPALERSRLPEGVRLQIVVVDNGSDDGSPEWLRGRPGVEPVVRSRPLGFAHANNAARAVARGDVVVFLNNDTEVEPGWLLRPLEILEADPTVAAVGSRLVFMHRFLQVAFREAAGGAFVLSDHYGSALDGKARWSGDVSGPERRDGRVGRWASAGAVLYVPLPEPDLDGPQERPPTVVVQASRVPGPVSLVVKGRERVLARLPGMLVLGEGSGAGVRLVQNAGSFVARNGAGGDVGTGLEDGPEVYGAEALVPSLCGAALIARRTALDAAGWFPRYYSMYYEDTDLCLRLRQAGGRLVYCPSSIVRHYHTGTSREWSPAFIEHVARSSLLFTARFAEARVLARSVRERLRHARAELARLPRAPIRAWRGAHGTRGTLRALLPLPRVAAERLLDAALRRPVGAALLGTPREPYLPPPQEPR